MKSQQQQEQQQTRGSEVAQQQGPATDLELGGLDAYGNGAAVDALGLGSGSVGPTSEGVGVEGGASAAQPGWAADLDEDGGEIGAAGAGDATRRKQAAMSDPGVRAGVTAAIQGMEAEYLRHLRSMLEEIARNPKAHAVGRVAMEMPIRQTAKVEVAPEIAQLFGAAPGQWLGIELATWTLPLHISELSPGQVWTTITGSCGDFVAAHLKDHGDRYLATWYEDVGVSPFTARATPFRLLGVPDTLIGHGPRA